MPKYIDLDAPRHTCRAAPRDAEGDVGLRIARVEFDRALQQFVTARDFADVGKRAAGKAQHIRRIGVESNRAFRFLFGVA